MKLDDEEGQGLEVDEELLEEIDDLETGELMEESEDVNSKELLL